MSTILPENEALRRAIKWISEQLQDDPDRGLMKLIDAASTRFNLSPREANFLIRFYQHDTTQHSAD